MVSPSTPTDLPTSRSGWRDRWRRTGLAAPLLGVLVLLCVGAPPPAAAAELVTFVDTTATLPPQQVAQVSFPVTPAEGVQLGLVTAQVLRVRRGEVEIPAPAGLTPKVEQDLGALVLRVPGDQLAGEGTYSVLVGLQRGADRQLVTVTLTKAAAVVTAPATVRVERTTAAIWGTKIGEKTVRPRLTLVGSPGTRLLTMTGRQLEAEDPQVRVSIPGTSPLIGPNGSLDLEYTVEGATGPASVTRTVQLSSPQLSQPVQVTFTVVTRRSPFLIAVALAIGLVIGFVLRVALPKLTGWLSSQRQRNTLVEELERWKATYADPDFQTTIDGIVQLVRAAKGNGVSTTVRSARVDADSALQHLQDELTRQDARYRAAGAVFRTRWRVPADTATSTGKPQPGIEDGLRRMQERLDVADAALSSKSATDAARALDDVQQGAADLTRTIDAWGAQAKQSLLGLRDQLQSCDRGALGNLKVAIATAVAHIPAEPAHPSEQADAVQAAEASLHWVHDTTSAYASAGPYLADLADEADQVAGILTARSLPADDLEPAADALRALDPGDDPARAGTDIDSAVRRLVAAARSAIIAAPGAGNDPAVLGLLTRGALVDAAQELARVARANRLGSTPSPAMQLPPTAMPAVLGNPVVVLAQPRTPIADRLRMGPGPVQLALVGGLAGLLHLLVAVVVVAFTGYALFLPNWTGSFADLTKVVLWAVAIDVSVAGLTLLLTSQATTPST